MEDKIAKSAGAWDKREFGADMEYAKAAPEELQRQIDEALGLKLISIRLPANLIEAFKLLAQIEGVGYQPLMRDVLARFADSELKRIVSQTVTKDDVVRAQKLIKEVPDEEKRVA